MCISWESSGWWSTQLPPGIWYLLARIQIYLEYTTCTPAAVSCKNCNLVFWKRRILILTKEGLATRCANDGTMHRAIGPFFFFFMEVDRRGVEGNVGKICMCGSSRDNNELVKNKRKQRQPFRLAISSWGRRSKYIYVRACRYVCLYDLGLSFGFSHGTESIQFRTLYAACSQLWGWLVGSSTYQLGGGNDMMDR